MGLPPLMMSVRRAGLFTMTEYISLSLVGVTTSPALDLSLADGKETIRIPNEAVLVTR